jgi:hypothetical protein
MGKYYDKSQHPRQHGKPCDIQMLVFLVMASRDYHNNTLQQAVKGECAQSDGNDFEPICGADPYDRHERHRNRLEVVLAQAGQTQVGADQIHVGNALARPYRLQAFREPTLPIDDRTDHWQTACGRMDFGVAMLEDERHRESHRLGEMNRSGRCPN